MLAQHFEKPVRVLVGLGFPRQLNTVVDAYQMLMNWNGNSPEQKAAVRACKAALCGEVDCQSARKLDPISASNIDPLGAAVARSGSEPPHSAEPVRADWIDDRL